MSILLRPDEWYDFFLYGTAAGLVWLLLEPALIPGLMYINNRALGTA
jgi:hypothetical protein